MTWLQGMRRAYWSGGGSVMITQLILRQPTRPYNHPPHSHTLSRTQPLQLCNCGTQKRIFLTLSSARSDSKYQYDLSSICCGVVNSKRPKQWKNKPSWTSSEYSARSLMTSPTHYMFWERDPKAGYGDKTKHSRKELVREGLKELRTELSKWREEMKEKFEDDPILIRPGDMDKMWVLDTEESLESFKVTSDSDHGEGFSSATLTISPTGHGLFSGNISTQVPKDGRVKKAGYCNITSLRPRRSFKRDLCYDWSLYTHLEMRVRGDGRSYLINVNTAGYFDVTWNDVYSYVLYTRGGPHWQLTRIPFSKFFLSSKGRVQDKQGPILLRQVTSLGISAGDRINAPFHLEIDYIGVYRNPDHTETFAYEMYRVPKFMSH